MATRFALSAIWSTSRSKNEWRRPDLRAAVLKAAARSGNLAVSCFTLAGTDQLEELGCWRQDRDTGKFGLTLAGLLMFGKHQAIISPGAAPQYLVDFRGYRGRKPQERWADRLFPDGTWEANLFLFYQRSWPKIVADLKVPFTLKGVQRVDETPVHEALREAVVNAMIHSDYKVGGGIVIMRYDDSYMLENPGTLLVSQEQLRRGGVSECRNKSLQRMFMLIGVGEQAGSCFARIQDGWKDQQWRAPRLTEQHEPDRVRLDMPMISLMPQWAFAGLRERIGPDFERLAQPERIALATAMIEGDVTNTRMQDLVKDHPSDITKLLRGLVGKSLLDTDNQRRWTRYRLPASTAPRRDLFSGSDSTALVPNSTGLPASSTGLQDDSTGSLPKGEQWKAAATRVSGKGKVPKTLMETTILELCKGRFLTLVELANLLDRSAPNLRGAYITPMVQSGRLRQRYPETPNRPDQAYTTAEDGPTTVPD